MVAMKLTLVACLVLTLFACTDPNSFQPFDPTKPDPPAPPQLVAPADSWVSDSYAYPQKVNFGWQAVLGAQFYQIEVYRDSLLRSEYLRYSNQRVTQPTLSAPFSGCGLYYWRVRAASKNWNNYTDWSSPFRFGLPNPAK
jgi:hypothetical protein